MYVYDRQGVSFCSSTVCCVLWKDRASNGGQGCGLPVRRCARGSSRVRPRGRPRQRQHRSSSTSTSPARSPPPSPPPLFLSYHHTHNIHAWAQTHSTTSPCSGRPTTTRPSPTTRSPSARTSCCSSSSARTTSACPASSFLSLALCIYSDFCPLARPRSLAARRGPYRPIAISTGWSAPHRCVCHASRPRLTPCAQLVEGAPQGRLARCRGAARRPRPLRLRRPGTSSPSLPPSPHPTPPLMHPPLVASRPSYPPIPPLVLVLVLTTPTPACAHTPGDRPTPQRP